MKKHYLAIIAAAMLAIPAWTPAEAFATSAENVQTRADEEFTLSFRHSRISDVIGPSSSKLTFTAETNKPANISITINGTLLDQAENATKLKATNTFGEAGDYEVTATATADGQTLTKTLSVCYAEDPKPAADQSKPRMGSYRNADGSVTFTLCAPQKQSVILVGSFNNWKATNKQLLQYVDTKESGNDIRYFTLTLPKSEVGTGEFMYYFLVDGKTAVSDPYARLVLDPENDKYITAEVYPNMPQYPTGSVPKNTVISVFSDTMLDYDWKVTDFKGAAKDNLVIYEMLFRDFTGTEGAAKGNGTVRQDIEKIPYLKQLGINAVELLPINEFNGNISWGYNPNFYFAVDKAYGTPRDYKEFIDKCHAEGIAVILDMVFNQTDWQHPWYKMYSSGSNPFFNATAPHAYSVLNDWKQEFPPVQEQFRDALKFWLTEYKVDGFRFDLVKGLGDNSSYKNAGDAATNAYNYSRVARMKSLHDAMREVNPDAYFINENLAGAKEENEMAADGELNWANVNNAGCQYAMGWSSDSSLTRMNAVKDYRTAGSTVAYLESHDEQRLAYKQIKWGVDGVKDNHTAAMQRCGAAAAQMILVPGSHMIWQFSEMGNDQNTKDDNGGNNTSPKIVNWNLLNDPDNKGLMECYAEMIAIRLANTELFNGNENYKNNTAAWSKGRTIETFTADKELYCVTNPNVTGNITVSINFRNNNQNNYYVASKSYGSNPSFDAAAKTVTIEPNCYAVIATNNVSAVDEIADNGADAFKAYGVEGGIRVTNAAGNVDVYTLTGQRVASAAADGVIALPQGIYIVRSGSEGAKVLVK